MDSLTQIVLGAAVGYAVAGEEMGKKALLWGAAAGLLPDLDVIPLAPIKDELLFLKYHRGVSHSIVFSIFGPLCVYGLARLWKKNWPHATKLAWIFFWGFATHILLDCFTTWGTQVFWPHPYRMAFNSAFIIDPLYTIPLIISVVGAATLTQYTTGKRWVISALTISTLYLGWGICAKAVVNNQFRTMFAAQEKEVIRFTSRPTAFNSILWSATAETKDGYYYAMYSLLDKKPQLGPLHFTAKNRDISSGFSDKRGQLLLHFTKGFYTAEPLENGVLIHDLRYGFMGDPILNGPNYVFSYALTRDSTGKTVVTVHNPRPSNTNELLGQLWERLKGV